MGFIRVGINLSVWPSVQCGRENKADGLNQVINIRMCNDTPCLNITTREIVDGTDLEIEWNACTYASLFLG